MTSEIVLSDSEVMTDFGVIPREDLQGWDLVKYYFAPLLPYYLDESVTEIMVNRFDYIVIERANKLERIEGLQFESETALQSLIFQVANRLNQLVDDDNPVLHARFPDGSRLCCTLPIVSPGGATITLRCKPRKDLTFDDLIAFGALTPEMVDYIGACVSRADSMLVTGNTGSGKTSLLRACGKFVGKSERMVTAEDTLELHMKRMIPGTVAMEAAKRRTPDGVKPLTLANLIETMLRQRPDRPWVGEVRDAAAADAVMQLSNTGHEGLATSLHANGPEDAIRRFQYLLASAGLVSYELAGHQVMNAFQLLIHCHRSYKFGRKVTHISRVEGEKIIPVFIYNEKTGLHERVDGQQAGCAA